ncbi:MAG: hypothetical protein H6742_05475 [Alphaproteobacteria bacterium]|nr:hypothetical protein [Alphaproteobacteria bacterium]
MARTETEGRSPRPIRIRGARTHNLQGVDLDLPRSGLTMFVGPSGSGKSSLAVDTLHAESRARLATALGDARLPRPPVDSIEELPLTLLLRAPATARAGDRVAEEADLIGPLATVAAAIGTVHCPHCDRALPHVGADAIVRRLLALPDGSRLTLLAPAARGRKEGVGALVEEIGRQGFARVRLDGQQRRVEEVGPLREGVAHDLDVVVDRVRLSAERSERLAEAVGTALAAGHGRLLVQAVQPDGRAEELSFAERPWCPDHPDDGLEPPQPEWLARRGARWACERCGGEGRIDGDLPCPVCAGAGLRAEARGLALPDGSRWPALLALALSEAAPRLADQADAAGLSGPARALRRTSALASRLLLGHLPLDRAAGDLADGERSRLGLLRVLTLDLPAALLILDEPVAGLDQRCADAVAAVVRAHVDDGAAVLAIDHRGELLAVADRVVAFGPAAGHAGGRLTWSGPASELPAELLPAEPALPASSTDASDEGLRLYGARGRCLDGVDLQLPIGGLTAVTGPSGSGKSTLLLDTLQPALRQALGLSTPPPLPFASLDRAGIERILVADRRPLGGGRRSMVATVLDLWTPLRTLLAQTREARISGLDAGAFRLDRAGGRCTTCEGAGELLLPTLVGTEEVAVPCPDCGGRRFQRDLLRVRLKGMDVAELLELELSDAAEAFAAFPRLAPALLAARVVGLGHLPLGRAADGLSGGEAQRLRLASVLASVGGVGGARRAGDPEPLLLLLDGPTVGLHPTDADAVVEVLRRIAERGVTVAVATVAPRVLAAADRVLRLPGVG